MFESVKYISGGKFVSRDQWKHPDRIIDSYELILVIKGEVFINCNNIEYSLKENDMLIISPGERHFGFTESSDTSFYWVHWQGDTDFFDSRRSFSVSDSYSISVLFNLLLSYASKGFPSEMTDYAVRLILGEINFASNQNKESRTVNTVAEWIKSNCDVMIKASDVALHFGYNCDYLSRLFKKAFKRSLKEYINITRMEYAKSLLLNSNITLNEVAQKCGFEEYKYFLKFFKYHEKMTPTEFCNIYPKIHINNK